MGKALAWSLIAIVVIAVALFVVPYVSMWITRMIEGRK
jgi:hypothetical protein